MLFEWLKATSSIEYTFPIAYNKVLGVVSGLITTYNNWIIGYAISVQTISETIIKVYADNNSLKYALVYGY